MQPGQRLELRGGCHVELADCAWAGAPGSRQPAIGIGMTYCQFTGCDCQSGAAIGNRRPKNSNLTVRLAIARRRLAFSRRRLPISPRQPGFARHMVPIHGGQWGSAARRRRWANPASAETRSFAMPPARRPSRNCQPRTAGGAAPHGWQASSISNGIFIVESQACMIEHVAPHPSDSLFSFGNAHVQLCPQTHLHHRAPRR